MPEHTLALDDLSELRVFACVVETGSFSSAARALGTTPSAVSKRIAALEDKLGTRLFHRTTRKLTTTDAGRGLDGRVRRILDELRAAEHDVLGLGETLRGVVRMSAPVTFGSLHVAPLVADFLVAHPALRIELALDDRYVDVVGEEFDIALRAGKLADSTLVARKLAPDRRVLCASPAYLARHGEPRTPTDLESHACMRHSENAANATWSFEGPDGPISVKVSGPLRVNHGGALREAALAGLGIVLLPWFIVSNDVRDGTLRLVLEDHALPSGAIYALTPDGHQPTKNVRALLDWLATHLPSRLRTQ